MKMVAILLITACSSSGKSQSQPEGNPAPSPPPPVTPDAARAAAPQPSAAGATTFAFDVDAAGKPPTGFGFGRTGGGAQGRWEVRAEADAPSPPNVLAQLDADDTDERFPVAVADAPSLRDLRLSMRCKPVSGKVDQACGLVFRYRDPDNYYVTRANALEGNVRLYFVKDGKRQQIASWSGMVAAGAWHDYAVDVRGDRLQVSWDGKAILDHHDGTFADAGKVGLWTKADSVTYFDDLRVEAQ
jgi:hypothetical protein